MRPSHRRPCVAGLCHLPQDSATDERTEGQGRLGTLRGLPRSCSRNVLRRKDVVSVMSEPPPSGSEDSRRCVHTCVSMSLSTGGRSTDQSVSGSASLVLM